MLSQSLFKKTAHPLFFIKVSLVVTKKHMSKGQNCLVNTVRCVNDNMFRGGGVKWESHWAKLILNVSFIHRTLFYFHTLASNPLGALLVIPPKSSTLLNLYVTWHCIFCERRNGHSYVHCTFTIIMMSGRKSRVRVVFWYYFLGSRLQSSIFSLAN